MSYWDELKYQTRYLYVGERGWEVKVYWDKGLKTSYGFPRSDRDAHFDLKLKLHREKLLAKAAFNREDYQRLVNRIDGEGTWKEIAIKELSGEALRNWLLFTPTNSEFRNSLFYG